MIGPTTFYKNVFIAFDRDLTIKAGKCHGISARPCLPLIGKKNSTVEFKDGAAQWVTHLYHIICRVQNDSQQHYGLQCDTSPKPPLKVKLCCVEIKQVPV